MKVTLPMMVQDQVLAGVSKLVEGFEITTEPFFLDGPVTERVAILDFDETSGELLRGTPFYSLNPTKKSGPRGEYRLTEKDKLYKRVEGKKKHLIESRDFNRVSVLATILKTMALFEDESVLGRRLSWAFDGPQLLVIPRAGQWANAFYQRETQSIQFFFFPRTTTDNREEKEMVYTSLSRDIIVHETAHAILDGIVPDLYNATTPQSLAIHEALADLTAVILAFKSGTLSRAVLDSAGGEIDRPSEFSWIAEEFGREHSGSDALRELYNPEITLDEVSLEPHFLSVVLSSALYDLMIELYNTQWETEFKRFKEENEKLDQAGQPAKYENPRLSSSGKALAVSAIVFERFAFGALDFLPPGEVSFADYGRALIATQRNLISSDSISRRRKALATERVSLLLDAFKKRGIALSEKASQLQTDFKDDIFDGVDLDDLLSSDWIAYQFANNNRDLLSIPPNISFEVLPRYFARKRLNFRPVFYQSQLFFKVSWTKTEEMGVKRRRLPKHRRLVVGTTLVIDLDQGRPIAVLHTDNDPELRDSRDEMLRMLLERDLLRIGSEAYGPHGEPLEGVIRAEDTGGALKLTGVANMLHITHD